MSESDNWFRDWSHVYNVLRKLTPSVLKGFPLHIEHEDVVQEVVCTLLRIQERLPMVTKPKAYLTLLLKRQAINMVRGNRRRAYANLGDAANSIEAPSLEKNSGWDLPRAFSKLLSDDELALLLEFSAGSSIGQLAEQHKISYSAMAQRLHRMKAKLAQLNRDAHR